jgi:glycosyltransferase involved in cell wall biosynthesis
MRAPLASIVISSYNYARYLPQTIESALAQTWRATEVIVVDDGSRDHSADVIKSYGSRITSLLKPNAGQGSVFNAGFQLSRGDLVCFLDSDDALLPTAMEKAVEQLSRGKASKVHWPLMKIDAAGNQLGKETLPTTLAEGNLKDTVIQCGPDSYSCPPTSGNAWARSYLNNVLPLREEEWVTCPDAYLELLAPFFGELRKVNEPQAYYRVHGSNTISLTPYAERARMFEKRCEILSEFLIARGIAANRDLWKSPDYLWWKRLMAAAAELEPVIPPGARYILADDHQLSQGQLLSGRQAIPFLEKDGQFWGPPPDDATAIAELARLRAAGATFLVFAWPAFWWLDHYGSFARHVRSTYPCIVDSADFVAFDLRTECPS